MKDLASFFLLMVALILNARAQNEGTVNNQTKLQNGNFGFGFGLENIGDLNKDGINDIIIGKPQNFDQEVFIKFLDSSGSIKSETIIASDTNGFNFTLGAEDRFGEAIANLGDINGDGIQDVAIGAPMASYNGVRRGAVFIVFLNRKGEVKDFRKIDDSSSDFNSNLNNEENFGFSLGKLQDWNNNGINELLVGSPFRKSNGAFWILFLDSNGKIIRQKEFNKNSDVLDNEDLQNFGYSIDEINDLNNDGISDLMIGDTDNDDGGSNYLDFGSVYALFLDTIPKPISIKKVKIINQGSFNNNDSLSTQSFFGSSLANLGDINGDTVQDIAVGAFGDSYPEDTNINSYAGKVKILFMNNDGSLKGSLGIGLNRGGFMDTLKSDDRFGSALANLGDLNGDNVPELGVGAAGKGVVYVLFLHGVPQSSGIREGEPVQRLKAYPNPLASSKPLRIQISSSIKNSQSIKVTVFDMQGWQVHRADFTYQGQREIKVDLPKLPSGAYQLYMKAGEFQGFSKIVVE